MAPPKRPPEGARWNIPDWNPYASEEEERVRTYLDQVEELRVGLEQARGELDMERAKASRLERELSARSLNDYLDLLMPGLGSASDEPSFKVSWKVASGQSIKAGDVIAELENDKATMEFEAPYSGEIAEIIRESGSLAMPGVILARIKVDVESLMNHLKAQGGRIAALESELATKVGTVQPHTRAHPPKLKSDPPNPLFQIVALVVFATVVFGFLALLIWLWRLIFG